MEKDVFGKLASLSRARSSMCGEMSVATTDPDLPTMSAAAKAAIPVPVATSKTICPGRSRAISRSFGTSFPVYWPTWSSYPAAAVAGKWSRSSTILLPALYGDKIGQGSCSARPAVPITTVWMHRQANTRSSPKRPSLWHKYDQARPPLARLVGEGSSRMLQRRVRPTMASGRLQPQLAGYQMLDFDH
jgi:hypothetical protein